MIILNQWFLVTPFLWTWHVIEWWLLSHNWASLEPLRECHIGEIQPQTDYVMSVCMHTPKDWVSSASTSTSVYFQWTYFVYSTFKCTFLHGYKGPSCEHHFPLGVEGDVNCQCQSHKDTSHTRQCKNFCNSQLSSFIVIAICFNFLLVILTRTFMSYICCTSFPLTSTLQVVGGPANNGFSKKILHVLGSIFSRLHV